MTKAFKVTLYMEESRAKKTVNLQVKLFFAQKWPKCNIQMIEKQTNKTKNPSKPWERNQI